MVLRIKAKRPEHEDYDGAMMLAKPVVETGGIFWAWFIHFLQDIVIFSAFVKAAIDRARQLNPFATCSTCKAGDRDGAFQRHRILIM